MRNLTHLPYNLPGKIYRSPMPFGSFDDGHTTLDEYKRAGINIVLMLTTPDEDLARSERDLETLYAQEGFEAIRLPIVDFDVPENLNVLKDTLKKVITKAEAGENIVIHCYAGRGRTGMFAALLARRILGLDGEEAIAWTRQFFPAVETAEQKSIVLNDNE